MDTIVESKTALQTPAYAAASAKAPLAPFTTSGANRARMMS